MTLPREAFEIRRPYMVLDEILASHDFNRTGGELMPLVYNRGSKVGDFLLKCTGLKLIFDESHHYGYTRACIVTIEARWMILLDTGSLWLLLQSIKQEIESPMQPLWESGLVDVLLPHIEIKEAESGKLLANVAPEGNKYNVAFIEEGSLVAMKALKEQLDFYFGSKQEAEPWQYAIHHCSTSANIYSPIRWSYKSAS